MPEVTERGVRLRLQDIPWTRVADLDLRRTAVFLLSGPLEQHGPHLPMGADLYQAAAVMDRVVRRVSNRGWNVLIAPAAGYTTAVLSRRYPGSVSVRRDHLGPYFIDVLDSFAANGLKQLVVFSQHLDPPHVLAWEEACREAGHNTGARAIEGYEVLVVDDLRSGALRELFGKHGEGDSHAGIFETSIMLAVRAGLVDMERAASLPRMPIDFDRRLRAARDFRELGNGLGYTGSPGAASAAIGRALIRRYARVFGDLVLEHLGGGDVSDRLSAARRFGA